MLTNAYLFPFHDLDCFLLSGFYLLTLRYQLGVISPLLSKKWTFAFISPFCQREFRKRADGSSSSDIDGDEEDDDDDEESAEEEDDDNDRGPNATTTTTPPPRKGEEVSDGAGDDDDDNGNQPGLTSPFGAFDAENCG